MPSTTTFIKKKKNQTWFKSADLNAHMRAEAYNMSRCLATTLRICGKKKTVVASFVHSWTNWFRRWEQHPSFCSWNMLLIFFFFSSRDTSQFIFWANEKAPDSWHSKWEIADQKKKLNKHGVESLGAFICIQQRIRSSKWDSAQRKTQQHQWGLIKSRVLERHPIFDHRNGKQKWKWGKVWLPSRPRVVWIGLVLGFRANFLLHRWTNASGTSPGSSLTSSAVLPSSMSKSMSRTVLWSWFRGTEEGGDTGLDKGLMPGLHFSHAPARGYCLALCDESARRNQCRGLVRRLCRKTWNCTRETRGTTWT